MRIDRGSLAELRPQGPCVLTMGSFDGLHLGHRALIRRVLEVAREQGRQALLLTFEPHPREVLTDDRPPVARLTLEEEKLELLEATGLDRVVLLRFTPELADWEPERFVSEGLLARIGMRHLVAGDNHAFGRRRRGDQDTLRRMAGQLGFGLDLLGPVLVDGERVSSTRVRQALLAGQAELATSLLGRPFRLTGRVGHGHGRGRELGFPTANLVVDARQLLPADGVYAVGVRLADGRRRGGMLNLGPRPTFGETERTAEVHVLGLDDSLYDQALKVDLLTFIRDTIQFQNGEQLTDQLRQDRNRIQEWLEAHPGALG